MATIKETLEACQTLVNYLAVNRDGFSYKPASMIELSNHISVALESLKSTNESKRIPNFTSGEVVCECGEKFSLFYNGGELDMHTCKCGLIYKTEHRQIDLVIYKQQVKNE